MGKHSTKVDYRKRYIWAGVSIVLMGVLVALIPAGIDLTATSPGKGMAGASTSRSAETLTNSIPLTTTPPIDRAAPRSPVPTGPPITTTPTPMPTTNLINYKVVPGDNLTTIAAKFKVAGYVPLYQWNLTVVGKNPNLIRPGTVLVIAVQP